MELESSLGSSLLAGNGSGPLVARFCASFWWFVAMAIAGVSFVMAVTEVVVDALVIEVYFRDGDSVWGQLAAAFVGLQWMMMLVSLRHFEAKSPFVQRVLRIVAQLWSSGSTGTVTDTASLDSAAAELPEPRSVTGATVGRPPTRGVVGVLDWLRHQVVHITGILLRASGAVVLAVVAVDVDKVLILWERRVELRGGAVATKEATKAHASMKAANTIAAALTKAAPVFSLHVYVMLVNNIDLKYASRRIRGRGLTVQVLSAFLSLLTMSVSTMEALLSKFESAADLNKVSMVKRLLFHTAGVMDVLVHVLRIGLFAAAFHAYLLVPLGMWAISFGLGLSVMFVSAFSNFEEDSESPSPRASTLQRTGFAVLGFFVGALYGAFGFLFGPLFLSVFLGRRNQEGSDSPLIKFIKTMASALPAANLLLTVAMVALPFTVRHSNHLFFHGKCHSMRELDTVGNCFPWWFEVGAGVVCLLQLVSGG
jgi:hypothetical protein